MQNISCPEQINVVTFWVNIVDFLEFSEQMNWCWYEVINLFDPWFDLNYYMVPCNYNITKDSKDKKCAEGAEKNGF